jgi:hypothetical protein
MSTELTVLNNNTQLAEQPGGQGVDFNNPLFNLRPATLTIVQPSSTIEGAIKGNLRISDTGDEFKEMHVALLNMPSERRAWYSGEPGELNRSPENLMCFSNDMIAPHGKAKVPQALKCASCSKSDWGPYRQYKEKNGKGNKALIPQCDAFYLAYLIDTEYQLPLRMYIRAKAKTPFEQGMQNVARTIAMAKARKLNPNIYDVKFKLSTKMVQDGNYKYYVPVISEPKLITPEEREVFGAMYQTFTSGNTQKALEETETTEISAQQKNIDNVVEAEYIGTDGAVTI